MTKSVRKCVSIETTMLDITLIFTEPIFHDESNLIFYFIYTLRIDYDRL